MNAVPLLFGQAPVPFKTARKYWVPVRSAFSSVTAGSKQAHALVHAANRWSADFEQYFALPTLKLRSTRIEERLRLDAPRVVAALENLVNYIAQVTATLPAQAAHVAGPANSPPSPEHVNADGLYEELLAEFDDSRVAEDLTLALRDMTTVARYMPFVSDTRLANAGKDLLPLVEGQMAMLYLGVSAKRHVGSKAVRRRLAHLARIRTLETWSVLKKCVPAA